MDNQRWGIVFRKGQPYFLIENDAARHYYNMVAGSECTHMWITLDGEERLVTYPI